jgi:hypothetical protein
MKKVLSMGVAQKLNILKEKSGSNSGDPQI